MLQAHNTVLEGDCLFTIFVAQRGSQSQTGTLSVHSVRRILFGAKARSNAGRTVNLHCRGNIQSFEGSGRSEVPRDFARHVLGLVERLTLEFLGS